MSSTALLLLLLLLFCLQTHTILTTRTHLGSFGGSSSIRNVRSARSEDNLALLRDRRSPRGVHSETDHRTGQLTKRRQMVSVCNPFSATTSPAVKALRGTETVPKPYPAEILWPAPYASTPLLLLLPDRTWLPRTTAAAGKYPRACVFV
ncbi:uncharacterized protein LOC119769414 [Culex quinquefasciatus]|uniref:uncharacterized protein LOC119769414 n=1 Tax=Culex quinquefasciatus TaxID=7176 RepID=UPI0018E3F917|nr:uncharacterized protein LOC119769414 [Culex quinquefasciatus]